MTTGKTNINTKLKRHFFLLMAACVIGTLLSGPNPGETDLTLGLWVASGLTLSLISILPLLFFIPTVLNPNPRSVSWLGFFLLAYLVWAILKMFSPSGLLGGLLISVFNLTTFTYAVIWLRPYKKQAKARQKS